MLRALMAANAFSRLRFNPIQPLLSRLLVGFAISLCVANASAQLTGLRVIEQSVSTDATAAVQTTAIAFNFPIDPATANQANLIIASNVPRNLFLGARIRVENNIVYVTQPTSTAGSNPFIRITTGLKSLPVNGIRYATANYLDAGGASKPNRPDFPLAARGGGAASSTSSNSYALAARAQQSAGSR